MFLLLFLNTAWCFLIPAVITQVFIVAVELAIAIGRPTKEAKAELETYPVTAEAKISKCWVS